MTDFRTHMEGVLRIAALRISLILVTFAILIAGCSIKEPPTPAYPAGSLVTLGQPWEERRVSLWLMYEDSCSVDIVYNWVDGGSEARLTDRVCEDRGTIYYKVTVSSELREEMKIISDNLWVEEDYIYLPP